MDHHSGSQSILDDEPFHRHLGFVLLRERIFRHDFSSRKSGSLSKSRITGPVVGSVLGIATVLIVIYFTRRKFILDARAIEPSRDIKEMDYIADDSGDSVGEKSQSQSEMRELENNVIHELPAVEPVGSELSTPRD
ncbi:hypothetical protein D0Z07_5745 [Hyphodiscus hymeniophilus]|uniref:Uncharacterized protein n=1 Tax=Hyphodiscus hymeniophilus TaxID=353542 RepID=A0A9P6VHG3_9HELO|nr:hypothetical protein D0Z07_5745 [Hyphodiscus hymeniophilus]